jgi:hypothetical protein
MTKITFGLMQKETQEFMGFNENDHSRDAYSMFSGKRFETDSIKQIVDFMFAKPDKHGSYFGNDNYDPADFTPVAYIREESRFSQSIEIKAIELPEIKEMRSYATRSWVSMPDKLRSYYISDEKRVGIPDTHVEFLIADASEGQVFNEGDIVYSGRYGAECGQVLVSMEVPEEWPTHGTSIPDDKLRLLLVHSENAAITARLTYSDIEPLTAAPKI